MPGESPSHHVHTYGHPAPRDDSGDPAQGLLNVGTGMGRAQVTG